LDPVLFYDFRSNLEGNLKFCIPGPLLILAGCKGLEYYTPDAGMTHDVHGAHNPAQLVLPLLSALLPHVCAHWAELRELALVLQPDQPAGLHR
jgi:hypothetical protein